jgi:hypothetical protein
VSVKGIAGLPASLLGQLIAVGRGLNFQLTTDQPLARVFNGVSWAPSLVIARQRSGAASVACAGGLYDTAAKGGNAIVAVAQSWVTLAAGVIVSVPVANLLQTALLSNTPILSLTTGSTAAVTADVFVYGFSLD